MIGTCGTCKWWIQRDSYMVCNRFVNIQQGVAIPATQQAAVLVPSVYVDNVPVLVTKAEFQCSEWQEDE